MSYVYLQLDDGSIIRASGEEACSLMDCVVRSVSFERYREYCNGETPESVQDTLNKLVQFGKDPEAAWWYIRSGVIPHDWAIHAAIRYGHHDMVTQVTPDVPSYRAPLEALKAAKLWGHTRTIEWLRRNGHIEDAVWDEFNGPACKVCNDRGYVRHQVMEGCYKGLVLDQRCGYCSNQ